MKKSIKTFLQGFAMGSVDIIPGISGGTMALILNIYTKIIDQIRLINLNFLKNVLKLKFKKAFESLDLNFLIFLILGIFVAIISLARVISWTLINYPTYLYSFFLGLILISAILLLPRKKIKTTEIFLLIFGFIIAWIISLATPASTPNTYLMILLSGAIAICTMILPGISGAFILLLLGKYEFIILLLKNPFYQNNLLFIIIFIIGCLIGLLSFSRFLNFLLKKYYQPTLMLLIGFMLGALNKIWPFKQTIENQFINNQETIIKQQNIWPTINKEFFISLGLIILGIILGFYISKIKKPQSNITK
ncbi:MAG TPA: DUF368 domain-containing protein [bacterium]|nr:DUF368 domain-containing protein [bacterium]